MLLTSNLIGQLRKQLGVIVGQCPMLSDRCLSVLSVTPLYCGRVVGWNSTKLRTQIDLGPGHIVLDGDPAPPPPKGHIPNFRPISVVA